MMRVPGVLVFCAGAFVSLGLPTSAQAQVEGTACNPEPTDMTIAYGDTILCDIGTVGDTDTFRFVGSAGESVLIGVGRLAGSSALLCADLTKPDGSHVPACGGSVPFRLDVTLTQSGTYSVVISAGGTTGAYGVVLERVVPPSPTAQPIVYGDIVTGMLNPALDRDLFSFSGKAGDSISVLLGTVSGAPQPCVELVTPNDTVIQSCSQLNFTLTQAGTHTLDVFSSGASGTGQYRLSLLCANGPCVVTGPPSLLLTLTGCTSCHAGDQFTVRAELKNPAPAAVSPEIKLGLRLPDGTAANLLGPSGEHLVAPLPAALDVPFTLLSIPWPAGVPAGTWSVEATLLEVGLGKTFSRDVKTFQAAP